MATGDNNALSFDKLSEYTTLLKRYIKEKINSIHDTNRVSELTDVQLSTLSDNEVLGWDTENSKWINKTIPTASNNVLGGIKIDNNTAEVDENGVLHCIGDTEELAETFASKNIEIKNYIPFERPVISATSSSSNAAQKLSDYPMQAASLADTSTYNYPLNVTYENNTYTYVGGNSNNTDLAECPLEISYEYDYDNFKKDEDGKIIPSVKKVIFKNNSESSYNLPNSFDFVVSQFTAIENPIVDMYQTLQDELTARQYFLTDPDIGVYDGTLRDYVHAGTLTSGIIKNKLMLTGCPANGGLNSYLMLASTYSNNYSGTEMIPRVVDAYNTGHFGKGWEENYNAENNYNSRMLGFDDGSHTEFSEGFSNFNNNEFMPGGGSRICVHIYLSKDYTWEANEELVFEPRLSVTDSSNEYLKTTTLKSDSIYNMTLCNDEELKEKIEDVKSDLESIKNPITMEYTTLGGSYGNLICYENKRNFFLDDESEPKKDKMSIMSSSPSYNDYLTYYPLSDSIYQNKSEQSDYNWQRGETNFILKYPNYTNMIRFFDETELAAKNSELSSTLTLTRTEINKRPQVLLTGSSDHMETIILSEFYVPAKFAEYYANLMFQASFDGTTSPEEGSYQILYCNSSNNSSNGVTPNSSFDVLAQIDATTQSLSINQYFEDIDEIILLRIVYNTEVSATYNNHWLYPMIANCEGSSPYNMILPDCYAYDSNAKWFITQLQEYAGYASAYSSTSIEYTGLNVLNDNIIIPTNLTLTLARTDCEPVWYNGYRYHINKTDIINNPKYNLRAETGFQNQGYSSIYKINTYYLTNLEIDPNKYSLLFPVLVSMDYKIKESEYEIPSNEQP